MVSVRVTVMFYQVGPGVIHARRCLPIRVSGGGF
jgi:hypothetical protein